MVRPIRTIAATRGMPRQVLLHRHDHPHSIILTRDIARNHGDPEIAAYPGFFFIYDSGERWSFGSIRGCFDDVAWH